MDEIMTGQQERPYWEDITRSEIEQIIRGNIQSAERKMAEISAHFCTTGYYLRRQQLEEQWRETGSASFANYVRETYGKSRGWATRMMQINKKYSRGGNDPRLDDKYKAYTVSQLQEMLYLPDDAQDDVTPDMTVREIRAMRQQDEPEQDPDQEGCENEQNYSENGQKSIENEQNIAESDTFPDTLTPETVNTDDEAREWAEIERDVEAEIAAEEEQDDSMKREITRNEWVRMYDEMLRWLPEEITADTLKKALNNSGAVRDDFDMDCNYRGVTINNSKVETWATAARQLNAIRKAKAMQEAEEAAAAARPGYIDLNAEWQEAAADDQGGQQAPDQELAQESAEDVCDVAKSEGAAASDQDPEEAQDDGQEGSRQQNDDGEGAAGVIARNVRYVAWEVAMCARDARKYYDQLVRIQNELLEEGNDKLIPWISIKEARMKLDALEMLAATIRIHDTKDEED